MTDRTTDGAACGVVFYHFDRTTAPKFSPSLPLGRSAYGLKIGLCADFSRVMLKYYQIKKHTLKLITDNENSNPNKITKTIYIEINSNPRGVELSCWICGIVGNL